MLRHVNVLIIDGHPGRERLTTALLDAYRAALPPTATVTTIAVRDLTFDPTLHAGYGAEQPWEPDVARVARELDACDHVCFGFPMWWGAEPAPLLALLERVLVPGFAFRYRTTSVFWEKRLRGRSADLIVTMDSPPLFLRLVYGDPIGRRWRAQVLGFVGIGPVRVLRLGPTRRGGAARNATSWFARVAAAARSLPPPRRGKRRALDDRIPFDEAVAERRS